MVSMKKLAEKYLQGNLSNMEKEHLLYLIKNDQNVDEWLRTSIEMADEVMPDVVRDRVINNVFRSNTTAPAIRSRMPIWKQVMMICSVMVAMCVGAAVYHYTFRVDHMTGMFEVATNIGERSNVTLPDGTHVVLNAKTHERESEIVAQAGKLGAVTIATNMAGRGTDILLGGNSEFMAKQELKKVHTIKIIKNNKILLFIILLLLCTYYSTHIL